jgi:hypothetical protein
VAVLTGGTVVSEPAVIDLLAKNPRERASYDNNHRNNWPRR